MKYLITLLLFIYTTVAEAEGLPPKLIVPSADVDRQLGGSKAAKIFLGKGRKRSSPKSRRSRQSTESAKSSTTKSSKLGTGSTTKTNRSSRGKLFEGVNVIETPPGSLATATSTNSETDEESVTQFLADVDKDGDYKGLQKQNVIVGASALFALIAALVGVVALNRRAAKSTDENIIDSVEISPVEPRVRRDKPPVVDDADNSCDFFGLTSCLA